MAEFKDYLINMLIVCVFIFSIFMFGTSIGQQYGVNDLVETDKIDTAGIQNQIEDTNEQAKNWESSFRSDNPLVSFGELVFGSLWGIMKLIGETMFNMWNFIIQALSNVLGIPPFLTGTLTTILIVSLIFAAWRSIKQG